MTAEPQRLPDHPGWSLNRAHGVHVQYWHDGDIEAVRRHLPTIEAAFVSSAASGSLTGLALLRRNGGGWDNDDRAPGLRHNVLGDRAH
jgi:hypothetical protein